MKRRITMAGLGLALVAVAAGCTQEPTTLLGVTGRTIPDGSALALTFTPAEGREVTVTVQASTDLANPDFQVVEGLVDIADRDDIPFGDFLVIANSDNPGSETASFTAAVSEVHTIFVEEPEMLISATYSVTVTQR